MANGTGTGSLDFGAHPGSNEASVAITGLGSISATSKAEAWIMADDTSANHTASDHKYFGSFANLTCGTPTAATGFTVYARSIEKLTGLWTFRYVWAD